MDDHNDLFDKDFQELDKFGPSMRFAKNVVEHVKTETELLKPQKGPMYWIPRLCIASFGLITLLFVVILSTNEVTLDVGSLLNENRQLVIAIASIALAIPTFLVLDKFLKSLVLS